MNKTRPLLKYRIDIKDFKDDNEIITTIKSILKLSRDEEFLKNIDLDNKEKLNVEVSPNISFLISECN